MAQQVKNPSAMQETQGTWVLDESMATNPSIPAGKAHGQSDPAGYNPWGCKELDMTEHKPL